MAILQAILAALARYASTILNTAFGWATVMLFGKVPRDRQLYVTLSAVGALVWLVVVLGIAFPAVAVFIFSFVKLPRWVHKDWIRLAMLFLACVIPLLVGFDMMYTQPPSRRPQGFADKLKAVVWGYPYTIGMAITLAMMCVIAPVMQVRNLAKRWDSTHVAMMVEAKDYIRVLEKLQETLAASGMKTRRQPASLMLRMPTYILTKLAAGALESLVSERLTVLVGHDFELMLHPADLVIRGSEQHVARVHAVITERLGFTPAHLTWDEEANELEDRLTDLWHRVTTSGIDNKQVEQDLCEIERELESRYLPYEEWEVLFRERLLIEHELLRRETGVDVSGDPREAQNKGKGAANDRSVEVRPLIRDAANPPEE